MENIEWLLNGNPVVERLTKKYLLNQDIPSKTVGFINDYLSLYNHNTHQWGKGFYSPKWTSSHYTLMTLIDMEVNGKHPIYQDAFHTLLNHLLSAYHKPPKQYLDMCIAGMLLKMACYGGVFNQEVKQVVDFILDHKMSDGGWNCMMLRSKNPKISSVHTTLSVLEGLDLYELSNLEYRIEDIKNGIDTGIHCLLDRRLIYRKGKNIPINKHMADHHYPPRWKYDYLRVLEFLAKRKYPLCDEIKPALDLLRGKLKHGRLTKGSQIAGQIHFKLETEHYGYFNTLRAYKIFKEYDYPFYEELIHMDDL